MSDTRGTRLKRMMRQMVLGEGRASLNLSDTTGLTDCLEAVHHRGQPRQLLLAFPKEVLIVDTEIGSIAILYLYYTSKGINIQYVL